MDLRPGKCPRPDRHDLRHAAHGSYYRLLLSTPQQPTSTYSQPATAERLPQPDSVPPYPNRYLRNKRPGFSGRPPCKQQGTPARTSAPYTTREELPARTTDGRPTGGRGGVRGGNGNGWPTRRGRAVRETARGDVRTPLVEPRHARGSLPFFPRNPS